MEDRALESALIYAPTRELYVRARGALSAARVPMTLEAQPYFIRVSFRDGSHYGAVAQVPGVFMDRESYDAMEEHIPEDLRGVIEACLDESPPLTLEEIEQRAKPAITAKQIVQELLASWKAPGKVA